MRNKLIRVKKRIYGVLILSALMSLLTACTDSSSDGESNSGAVKFYNASSNSPDMFFVVDEDLDDEDEDALEFIYSNIGYGESTASKNIEDTNYFIEVSWQSEDSKDREDLTIVHQTSVNIEKEQLTLFVLDGDISESTLLQYNLPIINDENDYEEELFNFSILNLHNQYDSLQLHVSLANETFNEAVAISQFEYQQLTSNQKLEQEEYIFYLTSPDQEEILFQSEPINFPYAYQYIFMVKPSNGSGDSKFSVDILTWASFINLEHQGESGKIRVYNGIENHELLPNYTGEISTVLETIGDTISIDSLNIGEFSEVHSAQRGDYQIALTTSETEQPLLRNHLLTLSENVFKTVFFYLSEENVDYDGDGDVDEDGDGYVDEVEIKIQSMVVENNLNESPFQHNLQLLNLVNDDDYKSIRVYFVRSNELIQSAVHWRTVWFATPSDINLTNNTYEIYAVAEDDSSDIILASKLLVLDESSNNQFLLLERDQSSDSGYRMTLSDQNPQGN
ncbi:hypothetical protein [Thalassotalea aquiviva]|uniref:hypothetical protein n=1 Tax=Thalassotalea aquiviva TaxID=3242415 RepID=UPI00352AFB0D